MDLDFDNDIDENEWVQVEPLDIGNEIDDNEIDDNEIDENEVDNEQDPIIEIGENEHDPIIEIDSSFDFECEKFEPFMGEEEDMFLLMDVSDFI